MGWGRLRPKVFSLKPELWEAGTGSGKIKMVSDCSSLWTCKSSNCPCIHIIKSALFVAPSPWPDLRFYAGHIIILWRSWRCTYGMFVATRVLPTLVGSGQLQPPLSYFYHHLNLFYHHSQSVKSAEILHSTIFSVKCNHHSGPNPELPFSYSFFIPCRWRREHWGSGVN